MCGRFTLSKTKELSKRFNTSNKLTSFDKSYNIAPSQTLPTITRNSPNKITMMRWGFMFKPDDSQGIINIRKESTEEKPYFKKILSKNRCIIPTDGFYEWGTLNLEGKEEKYPFYFYIKGKELFGFAGIYNEFKDAEGKSQFSFAILTCPPNSVVRKVHNRMPVILERKNENNYLDPDNESLNALYEMLVPYPPKNMKFHPVTKRVNNPRNDDPGLIEKINSKQLHL